jgi:Starch-binding associating with outer membrane
MKTLKIFLPFIALLLFSCDDYLDINNNPNNPTSDIVPPNLILAAAHTNTYRTMATTANELGNVWMNNWGANVNAFTGGYADEFSLAINNSFRQAIWNNIYVNSGNYSKIINSEFPNYENHKAIAKIMKSYYFQYLVDLYGDIPYSEAHLFGENVTPAYDDDQQIYRALYDQLDEAISDIENAPATANAVGTEDVINAGDMSKWIRFANTLKLKLLIRQSELALTDADTQTYLNTKFAELVADGAAFIGAGESVTINPGYSNASDSRQNPFYGTWGLTLNGSGERQSLNFTRATDNIASNLNTSPPDGRRSRIFTVFSGNVSGVKQGDASQPTGSAPLSLSKIGIAFSPTAGVGTAAGAATAATGSAQNGYIMTDSESLLLQCEAVHRGYLPGNAKALFDAAITRSFVLTGATAASLTSYLTAVDLEAGKGWTATTNKIEAIMYQKRIALININGIESFIEYTRTGFPRIPLSMTAQYPSKPNRLMYPTTELSGNSANVPTQTLADVFDTFIFWDVTPPVLEATN